MRICLIMAALFALASPAVAEERNRPTAILVSPIHEAQVVRGDDGMDHVEYELLIINAISEPVTLAGRQLGKQRRGKRLAERVHTEVGAECRGDRPCGPA